MGMGETNASAVPLSAAPCAASPDTNVAAEPSSAVDGARSFFTTLSAHADGGRRRATAGPRAASQKKKLDGTRPSGALGSAEALGVRCRHAPRWYGKKTHSADVGSVTPPSARRPTHGALPLAAGGRAAAAGMASEAAAAGMASEADHASLPLVERLRLRLGGSEHSAPAEQPVRSGHRRAAFISARHSQARGICRRAVLIGARYL